VLHENPPKLPPGIVEDMPPDEESRIGSDLGTSAKVTWSWLKSKYGKPREGSLGYDRGYDRDYYNGKIGRLYINVRPYDAHGQWLHNLDQEFTGDGLKDAQKYGFYLLQEHPEVNGFWLTGMLDIYWTKLGRSEARRAMDLGVYQRSHVANARKRGAFRDGPRGTDRELTKLRRDQDLVQQQLEAAHRQGNTQAIANLREMERDLDRRVDALAFPEHTPNATIYGRKYTIRRGYLLVPQEMTGPGGKVYTVDLEYQVFDGETGATQPDFSGTVEGELHRDRLIVGDPHRDTRLYEYTVASQPTSESNNYWRGYQAALGDRQWHKEGQSKKYYANTQEWWDGYNQGHRDKRDPSAGYAPNGASDTEYRGCRIEVIENATQLGYYTGEGMRRRSGKGRNIGRQYLIHLGEAGSGGTKMVSTMRAAREYIDDYFGPEHTPNVGHYVWVLNHDGTPKDEGPYGPKDLESAKTYARIAATKGAHDRAVSRGLDPQGQGFEIVRVYQRGTGERVQ